MDHPQIKDGNTIQGDPRSLLCVGYCDESVWNVKTQKVVDISSGFHHTIIYIFLGSKWKKLCPCDKFKIASF